MHKADRIQTFIRSRTVRLTAACTLIAVGGWEFLPYLGYRTATSAFVNAELTRVAAPIAGHVTADLPRKGDVIEHAQTLPLVETLAPDRRHLLDLKGQYAVAEQRVELARKQLAEISTADDELAARMKIYSDGMINRLQREEDEAHTEVTGCLAEAAMRRDAGNRMQRLVQSGLASAIRGADTSAIVEATSTRCELAEKRAERLQVELQAAKQDVFLRDGSNDAPYSRQGRDQFLLRRQELESKVLEQTIEATHLAAAVKEETDRINRLSEFKVSLPAHHVVWTVAASPGSTVSEGQTILDLADCEHRFVTVELPEREFERIKPGSTAFVRLIGSGGWTRGTVQQVRGSAARTDDRLLAAELKRTDQNTITVEVGLPDHSQASLNSFCDIGRLAEVRFTRPGLAVFEQAAAAVTSLLEPAGHTAAVVAGR